MLTLLAAGIVTLQSLLTEMTDYEAVARWPDPPYTCHQASSYDRRTRTPEAPDGWFANGDQNQYIRIETNRRRMEKVMMDADGPGAIVRFWITTHTAKKGNLRIYLDHDTVPAITIPSFDFANNKALPAGHPLLTLHPGASPEGRGGNTLYLPIPYARHCKVTWEELEPDSKLPPRYYQINYRTYAPGTKVETFKPGHYDRANNTLVHPPTFTEGREVALDRSVPPVRKSRSIWTGLPPCDCFSCAPMRPLFERSFCAPSSTASKRSGVPSATSSAAASV